MLMEIKWEITDPMYNGLIKMVFGIIKNMIIILHLH